jgi:hypothetical protein
MEMFLCGGRLEYLHRSPPKTKEVKTGCNPAESSEEGHSLKRADVFPVLMMCHGTKHSGPVSVTHVSHPGGPGFKYRLGDRLL